ncbi:MAG: hypothetical protein ABSF67_10420 [Roseiarcus sp.]|jgi:hypothetical protein
MCAICEFRIDLAIAHPMTLSVAVATRTAIEASSLPPFEDAAPSRAIGRRNGNPLVLKALQQRLEASLSPATLSALPDFFVHLIERGAWAFFRATPSGFDPNCRPAPPRFDADDPVDRDTIVVTSEFVLRQMLLGVWRFDPARAGGLIVIDADPWRETALARAWAATFPLEAFSRFVCA